MADLPPPLPPVSHLSASARSSWWSTNWIWAIPAIAFACALVVCGFGVLVLSLMKSSGAYQEGMLLIRESKEVIAELGEPVEAGMLVLGEVKTGTHGGKARLQFSLEGPKEQASAIVLAVRSGERWEFQRISVTITKSGKRIEVVQPVVPTKKVTSSIRPNKSLQPTATAVMPPAAQEIMPAVAVAEH